MKSRPAPLLLVLLAAVTACLPGARAPRVTPARALELSEGPSAAPAGPASGAFAVVFGSPQGETDGASEVTVTLVFNRPMRALEAAEDGGPPAPARIVVRGTDRAPAGAWRWMGSRALVFAPEKVLPAATEFAVSVPAGTRALSGETLAAEYTLHFATPRPRVETLDPSGDEHLVPSQVFEARFNQPVDLREVERAATISLRPAGGPAGATTAVALRASRPDPGNPRLVKLAPARPLPLASAVTLSFDASLHGTEGPLPSGTPWSTEMQTYGPLRVVSAGCGGTTCAAGESIDIGLSNDIALSDLRRHVTISPPVALGWGSFAENATGSGFWMSARLQPGRSYALTVTAGLRDRYGQTMARDFTKTIDVRDIDPRVAIGLNGDVLEAALPPATRVVPISSVNQPSYLLATAALDPSSIAGVLATSDEAVFDLPGVATQRVQPSAARNSIAVKNVSLDGILAAHGGRGGALLATRVENDDTTVREVHVVNVTDLAITAKMSRFGSLLWVTRLSDGKAVPGAAVSVESPQGALFRGTTDADGLAVVPLDAYRPVDEGGTPQRDHLVVARLGDDWTWRRVNEPAGVGPHDGWSDLSGELDPMGMLFTDRGVYRPGETVKLQTIFRMPDARGTYTPAGLPVHVTVTDARDQKLFDGDGRVDDFGAATFDVPLPATAHLGYAQVRAKLGNYARDVSTSLQLAAYKASETKVGVEARAPSWTHGEEARFDVRGDYLFGAPMTGAKVRWNVTRAEAWFVPPGAEGFVVEDGAYRADLVDTTPRGEAVQTGEGALDARGAFVAAVPLSLAGQHGPERVTLEAEVEDVSRQTTASRASGLVHPASFYVALQPPGDAFVAKGDTLSAKVAAFQPSGKRRGGVAVHVDLVRRSWDSVMESGSGARGHWVTHVVDRVASSCDASTDASSLRACALAVPEPGFYLVHATARDEKGREASAAYAVYSIGEGPDFRGDWEETDANEVQLVPDKKQYQVGDVARILIKSPVRQAEALVTVERAGIYRQQRVHLTGATPTVSIPITEDLRPNAYVSVHLERGRSKGRPARGADVGAPLFKSGYASLVIDPESRRLQVALTTPRRDYRPGEAVDADVAVTDRAGKPVSAELTLWAVDEGVLMLTGYKTPDPVPTFTALRPLSVFTLESRASLGAPRMITAAEIGIDKGQDGGGGGAEPMRADFRATAWFQPGVVTGADGRAHARFTLPDNLTTFRLMAVAAARDDRFGGAEAQVTTSRPLMVRPALPRFLRAGDTASAGVVVTTKGLGPTRVQVSAAAEGLTLGGDTTREVDVPAGGSVEVRWSMAAPHAGDAKLSFRARGGGASDAVEVTRRVDAPAVLETAAIAGETRDVSGEKMGDLRGIRDDVGGLDVRVASTALVGVEDGMEQLLEYPYGCTEQLTSRLVPLVGVGDLARDFGLDLPRYPERLADAAVAQVLANQRGDGGFGWWPDSRWSDPWLTSYAAWGLDIAQKAGRPVPSESLARTVQFLRRSLETSPLVVAGAPWRTTAAAFAVDVLASMGAPDPGYTNRLYEERRSMPLVGRALLAHAIAVSKMDATQAAELLRDVEAHLRVSTAGALVEDNLGNGYAPILDSNARTTAIVLRALVAMDPRHPLAARLARGLLGERRNGHWRSTQEAAWALLALADYRRAAESEQPNFDGRVWIGGDLALEAPFHGRSLAAREAHVAIASVLAAPAAPMAFQVSGSGEMFYEARLRYARRELPREGVDQGLFVRKTVRAVQPEGLPSALATLPERSAARVPAGSLVLVDVVVVTATPRQQVVVDDPVPAGLELVDSSLVTTARSLAAAANGDGAEEGTNGDDLDDAITTRRAWAPSYFHRELHDDRALTFVEHMRAGMFRYQYLARATTPGVYVVPPTKAECMYEPETFGRTGASQLEVTAP
jgi:uncharacterized protein YfaS (alpha-2-macroglobulin family)